MGSIRNVSFACLFLFFILFTLHILHYIYSTLIINHITTLATSHTVLNLLIYNKLLGKCYYDENGIFPIEAILKHKQVVCMRRKMLFTIFNHYAKRSL